MIEYLILILFNNHNFHGIPGAFSMFVMVNLLRSSSTENGEGTCTGATVFGHRGIDSSNCGEFSESLLKQ